MKRYYLFFALLFYSSLSFSSIKLTFLSVDCGSGNCGVVLNPHPVFADSTSLINFITSTTHRTEYDSGGMVYNCEIRNGSLMCKSPNAWVSYRREWRNAFYRTTPHQCESGTEINPDTNRCEVPPEEDAFCGSSEYMGLLADEINSCAIANPGFFTTVYDNCIDKSNYSFTCVVGAPEPNP
ncbi:hypothetical protein GCS60_003018, partial [Vibrio metschnikovii]|nr:hypothetical protein [Vibrio metschnikovii]